MSFQPPPWGAYPQSWHPPSPPATGHDSLALGTTLGQLLAGQERTIFVLELIHSRLVENSQLMADRLPEAGSPAAAPPAPAAPAPLPPASSLERMTVRDWVQIGLAIGVVLAALAGRVPLDKALPLVLKPLGV